VEKSEYLNEENYQKANRKVKKVGNVLIIIGLILFCLGLFFVIGGFLGFGNQVSNGLEMEQLGINTSKMFSGFVPFAIGGLLLPPGLFITAVGFIVRFLIGNRREITAYTTQQVMPLAQEKIEKVAPTVGNAVGTIGKNLAKGIKEGLKEEEK